MRRSNSGTLQGKAFTNAISNRFGDGPDTAEGVRTRLGELDTPAVRDEDLELAISAVRGAYAQWAALGAGGKMTLAWPLSRDECRARAKDCG